MLKNYIKIAFRNISNNKTYSFLNIFGLAIGVSASLLILQYVRFETSYENSHKNADQIYRATVDLYNGNEYVETDCGMYAPFGPAVKEEMPEVLDFVRFYPFSLKEVKVEDKQFFEDNIYFTDPSAFTIFTYSPIAGNLSSALKNPFEAVITKSAAIKYFGTADVVDKTFQIENKDYKIQAVIEDLPPNTHLKYNFLLSRSSVQTLMPWYYESPWKINNEFTYLLLQPGTDLSEFNAKLHDFSESKRAEIKDEKFSVQAIKDIHLYSNKAFEPEVNGNAQVVYFLLVIGFIILIIACINYINLSTARAISRAKEVGIRKVVGSSKNQLVFQYFIESVIINTLAIMVAIMLVYLFLPAFLVISGHPSSSSVFSDPYFWYMLAAIFTVGIIAAGLYPAFVLSSFKPASVLKGKFQNSGHGLWLRKGLVVFQFSSAVVLIVLSCTIYLQINHIQKQDLGLKIDQTLIVRAPNGFWQPEIAQNIEGLKDKLHQNSEIRKISVSEVFPGSSVNEMNTSSARRLEDQGKGSYNYYFFKIDEYFFPTYEIKFKAGKNFIEGQSNQGKIIINEEAAQSLGFKNPEDAIGELVDFSFNNEGKPSTIIGVVANYSQRSPKEPHFPIILAYQKIGEYLTIQLDSESPKEALVTIQNTWKSIFPDNAFDYFFLDEQYRQQFNADIQVGNVSTFFAVLAIAIACLGLFGLSSFSITQRTKEIGIRKILGATIPEIVKSLSKDFFGLVIVASLVALPLAFVLLNKWLENYATRIELSWWIFMIPLFIVAIITILTVASQTIKAAIANPVDSLRSE